MFYSILSTVTVAKQCPSAWSSAQPFVCIFGQNIVQLTVLRQINLQKTLQYGEKSVILHSDRK